MNAPLIWIGIPLVAAVLLWPANRRQPLTVLIAAGVCALLALLAWVFPVDTPVRAGPLTVELSSTLLILGRRFELTSGDRTFLMLIYLFGGLWFLGAALAKPHRYFAPLALAIIAVMVAALAVEPFLYAALLIETAVLLSVPLLVPPGQTPGPGVLRYVIFQTLAMPFILFAGWASSGVETNPASSVLLQQAVLLMGLGFAFWLGVFPFYTWVPLMADETHPYAAGFLLSLLPMVVLMLVLGFLSEYTWLREYPQLPGSLRLMGILMVVSGGIWAAFQRSLTRLFGYAVIMENGFALLALSLETQAGFEVYAASFLPRAVALALWALALSLLKDHGSTDFEESTGLMRRYPFIAGGVLVACFSLGGFPLLAGFPVRLLLLENLAQDGSFSAVIWALVGSAGLLLSGVRALSAMTTSQDPHWRVQEGWPQRLFMTGGILAVLLIGLFPAFFMPEMVRLLQAFERLF